MICSCLGLEPSVGGVYKRAVCKRHVCVCYLAGAFFMCSPTKVALVMPISVLASDITDRRCCVVTALETPYVPFPTMSLRVSFRPVARDNCRSKDS